MISKIFSSNGIQVLSGSLPHINMSLTGAGTLRYNGTHLEAYDGYSWIRVSSEASIMFDYDTQKLLEWARKKRDEEQKIEKLKDNPAITDLLKQKADIDEKLKIVEVLFRDHNGTN